jgi:hypothetical protein
MSDQERQELIERLDRVEKQLKTGFTESGRKLSMMETAQIWLCIKSAKRRLGVVL